MSILVHPAQQPQGRQQHRTIEVILAHSNHSVDSYIPIPGAPKINRVSCASLLSLVRSGGVLSTAETFRRLSVRRRPTPKLERRRCAMQWCSGAGARGRGRPSGIRPLAVDVVPPPLKPKEGKEGGGIVQLTPHLYLTQTCNFKECMVVSDIS